MRLRKFVEVSLERTGDGIKPPKTLTNGFGRTVKNTPH
jgi:hypothetical protein